MSEELKGGVHVAFTLLGLKTYGVDAIAQRMVEVDPQIVPFGHFRFFKGSVHEDHVRR